MSKGKTKAETMELVYWLLDRERTALMPAANIGVRINCPKTSTENACRQLWKRGKISRKRIRRVWFYQWIQEEKRKFELILMKHRPAGWWFRYGSQSLWYGVFPSFDSASTTASTLQSSKTTSVEFIETTVSEHIEV